MQYRLSIPFVGGLCAVLTEQEMKKKVSSVTEKIKWTSLVAVGLGLTVAEVVTRKAADTLSDAARVVADYHDLHVEPALKENDQKMIDHAWQLVADEDREDQLGEIDPQFFPEDIHA